MNPADLQLPDDVDALKAMILAMAAETAELKAINATADERIGNYPGPCDGRKTLNP
jgi:hypothetical protein